MKGQGWLEATTNLFGIVKYVAASVVVYKMFSALSKNIPPHLNRLPIKKEDWETPRKVFKCLVFFKWLEVGMVPITQSK